VSLLWRDEVGVFVGPGKVALARMARGVRPKCVAERVTRFKNTDESDWQPACNALADQLDDSLWHDANARVVISDHWTRYAILPWSAAVSSEAERITHAKLILAATYGDLIDQWTVSLSDSRPQVAAIISAIPNDLLQQVNDLLPEHKLRLISLQPDLIVSYNSWRERLPDTAAWFASIDDGTLAALHLTDGKCDRVQSVRISDDWTVEIRRMQTMGRLARNRAGEGQVYVNAPVGLRSVADTESATLEWLDESMQPQNIADKVSALKGA
jgi:hypothetical protein